MPYLHRTSLKKRVLSAGAWSMVGYGLNQAMRFGSNLLLTRLLMPEMFGIMAVATLVQTLLTMFSDFGLNLSVIQSKYSRDRVFLNTIWVTQIVRGIVLWFGTLGISLLLVLADRIGIVPKNSVYADPTLPYVIAIISVTAIIKGAQSTKTYEASRDLVFGRITQIEIISQLSGLLFIFIWIGIDRSIWALVAGNIFWALITTLLSHVWLPGTGNRLEWDRFAFSQIMNFGKWIFLSSILGFLAANGDRVLLAGLVGTAVFGVYVIAFNMASAVDQILTRIIGSVAYIALSETVRERPEGLKANYYRFYVIICSFAYFCSGFLMVAGPNIMHILYDRRYEESGWMLQILAAALLTVPLRLATQCLLIFGLPNVFSHITTVRLVALYLSIPVGFHFFGLIGGLWAIVFSNYSALPITIAYAAKYGLFDIRRELLLIPVILLGALSAIVFCVAMDPLYIHTFLNSALSIIK